VTDALTQAVKAEARRLGFDLVGVTTPDPPPHGPVFGRWLAMGRHASMDYLARPEAVARRLDPGRVLPGCRSIVVLGARYPRPDALLPPDDSVPRGRVAAYAWGTDYHLVLPDRMTALAEFIRLQAGRPVEVRAYTDTGPLLERDLAQRAGLGWIGKNTCLIHPRHGSYFFLSELLLDIELAPDAPFTADRCGTCTRCIDACPTGCILPDRTLDAGRCISYLTIENKAAIPADLREQTGAWVFGCDVCQMVCPWNRLATADGDPAFAPRDGVPFPELIADLGLDARAFNAKFKDSPVQRARRRGYRRSLAVALGNHGGPAARAALGAARDEDEPLVREHIDWALERLKEAGCRDC